MVDKDIVQFSTSVEEYNLEPSWENYASLTEERNGFEPICSVDNFDIMSLLYIKENGYPEDGLVCEYPYDFSYENEFQDLSWSFSKLDSDEKIQQGYKALADELLQKHFPNIRQPEPEEKIKKSVNMRVETPATKNKTKRKGLSL